MLQSVDFEIITTDKKCKRRLVRVVRVKLQDRLRTLELIGKHVDVKAFVDRHEHSGTDGGSIPSVVHVSYHPDMKPPDMK